MKTALQTIFSHLQALRAFEEKYQPGEHTMNVGDVPADDRRLPCWTFDGGDSDVRGWVLATLGHNDWFTGHISAGRQTVKKTVDGVEVVLWRAYAVRVIESKPEPVNPACFGVTEVIAG